MSDTPQPTEPMEPSRSSPPPAYEPPVSGGLTREEEEALAEVSMFDLAEAADETRAPASDAQAVTKVKIVQVHKDDVFVDFGGKAEGVIPRSQFKGTEDDEPTVGRVVDVVFDRFDRESNLQIFSREGAARVATWETMKPGLVVEGRVTGMNKGGLEVDLKGIRGFMPASQVDVDRMLDISLLIGQAVRCEVLEVSRRDKNVLLSRRKIQEAELAAAREALLKELAEGQLRRGVVRNVTEYGAFVDLGGVDGLLHVSDMSWSQVDKPSDIVSIGQSVDVTVLKMKKAEDGRLRISLGLKQSTPDPWERVESEYPVGTQLKARIARLAAFGAFAEVEEGVEALVPISEMSWGRIHRPKDVVSVGDIVDVVVIRLEREKRRMALSMKQASPDPWEGVQEQFADDAVVTGHVTKLADFGAFVELRPGVEGLVHVSELSEQHVRTPGDVLSVGQEVAVKVLGTDMEQRRIALSIKAIDAAPEDASGSPAAPAKAPKKRKKPLRGGISSEGGGLFDGLLG
ncbi:MAG: S1 RNA-binding domain-containing protein [Phycisphaerales bacterium]|nr:MAG: S1 RNA-binding domain-containing protein [Phycisphaerales bacterium]